MGGVGYGDGGAGWIPTLLPLSASLVICLLWLLSQLIHVDCSRSIDHPTMEQDECDVAHIFKIGFNIVLYFLF